MLLLGMETANSHDADHEAPFGTRYKASIRFCNPTQGLYSGKPSFRKTRESHDSLWHYLQQTKHRSNQNFPPEMNRYWGYATCMQWTITQP